MSNISTGKTLRRLREKAGLTVSAVGSAVGRQSKTVNAWENGRGEPDITALITLSSLYGVKNLLAAIAVDMYGERAPINPELAPDEESFLNRFRSLDRYGKITVERVTDSENERVRLTGTVDSAVSASNIRYIEIPVSKHPFYPGNGVLEDELFDSTELVRLPENELYKEANFAVRVDGAGYEPRFSDGDILLIKRQPEIQIGEIGVFSVDGEVYLRGNGHGRLISINPGLDDIALTGKHKIRCIGKIIAKK
ncbi:MAG: helix-turn-helix domain-containing protein [Ruminococcus sp.]|nr:helix-turn-helix domain-containing protein [Ruminococcus sp.]